MLESLVPFERIDMWVDLTGGMLVSLIFYRVWVPLMFSCDLLIWVCWRSKRIREWRRHRCLLLRGTSLLLLVATLVVE